MSTSSIQSTTAIQDLAATLTRRLDADSDGRLSADEFSGFLTQLLGSLQSNPLTPQTSGGLPGSTLSSTATDREAVGHMGGFDAGKLANTSHDTTKYRIGRILQFYPNTPAGLREALPEIQQLVPDAKIVGTNGDKLDFGDYVDPRGMKIGVIDVIQASSLGGVAWQWLPIDE